MQILAWGRTLRASPMWICHPGAMLMERYQFECLRGLNCGCTPLHDTAANAPMSHIVDSGLKPEAELMADS